MRKIGEKKYNISVIAIVGLGRGDMRLPGGPAPLPLGDFRLRHCFVHSSFWRIDFYLWKFIYFSWNLYENSLYILNYFPFFPSVHPLVILLPSTALTSSLRLPRPSTFVCLVCHSVILCHKLIRPDLDALKCCQKLIVSIVPTY